MATAHIERVLKDASPEAREVIVYLLQQVEQLQRMVFGVRSEKLPPMARELRELPEHTLEGAPMPADEQVRQHELDRHARAKSEPQSP